MTGFPSIPLAEEGGEREGAHLAGAATPTREDPRTPLGAATRDYNWTARCAGLLVGRNVLRSVSPALYLSVRPWM